MVLQKKKAAWICLAALVLALGFSFAPVSLGNVGIVETAWAGDANGAFDQAWQKFSDLLKGSLGTLIAGILFLFGIFRLLGNNKFDGILCLVIAIIIKLIPKLAEGFLAGG